MEEEFLPLDPRSAPVTRAVREAKAEPVATHGSAEIEAVSGRARAAPDDVPGRSTLPPNREEIPHRGVLATRRWFT